jgi:hypothetical protein
MADITVSGSASLDGANAQFVTRFIAGYAGETLLAAAPCYVSGSQVLMSSSAVVETFQAVGVAGSVIKSRCDGWTAVKYSTGDVVTLFGPGAYFGYYASSLDSGSPLYVGTAAGKLSTVAVRAGDQPVARAIGEDIVVLLR